MQQGAAGRCLQAGTSMPAYREDMLVVWRVSAALPEGDSSSLAPLLCVGAQEGTLPLGKQNLSHTPAGYAHPQC